MNTESCVYNVQNNPNMQCSPNNNWAQGWQGDLFVDDFVLFHIFM